MDIGHIFLAVASLVSTAVAMSRNFKLTRTSYNSVVFMSLSAQTYGVFEFGPEAKNAIEDGSFAARNITADDTRTSFVAQIYSRAFKAGILEELSLLECINAYSTAFQSTRGNVFLVVGERVMDASDVSVEFPDIDLDDPGSYSPLTGTQWVYGQFQSEASKCFTQESDRFLPRLQANASM